MNYTRRFKDTDVFEKVFEHILQELEKAGLLDMTALYMDSTHQKANANKHKNHKEIIRIQKKFLDDEVARNINEDRAAHGKKLIKDLIPEELVHDEKTGEEKIISGKNTKQITVSDTDPESGLFHKGEKEKCFAYSQHVVCDGKDMF